MDKPDPSPSGASAANAPEGRDAQRGDEERSQAFRRAVYAAPKSEPEGQELSEEEIETVEIHARFSQCPCPILHGGLIPRLLAEVRRHRAQPQAHAQPAPADAAPLVALRRGFQIARENVIASSSGDGWSDRTYTTLHWEQAERKLAEALASAEGASAAPRDERPDELTLLWRAVTPILRSLFYCQFCDAPATCYGAYENRSGVTGSCDEHCGHGNEDGWCKRNDEWRVLLAEADKKPAPGKQSSGPSPDALRDEALDALEVFAALPDDLRAEGWSVAVHNDYQLNGEPHTFWLFTKGDRALKGEGRTDAEALAQARAVLRRGGRHE